MKKLLFIGTIMLGIASCSGTAKDSPKEEVKVGALINIGDEKTPFYCMTLEAEDGDKTKKKVEFMIDKLIIKDLKLNESKIRNMCQNAILYADDGNADVYTFNILSPAFTSIVDLDTILLEISVIFTVTV